MTTLLRALPALSTTSRSIRFEGGDHGSPVSFFLIDADPGKGTERHTHPYAETWVVRAGEVEFHVGNDRFHGAAGDIIIAPPEIPHRHVNTGNTLLQMICIHPFDRIVQDPA
ncbi:MAG: cupin domain-containing protein [Roseovarius sp.]|jgi:quercetin dioxygenase-like cupin family protein|nr:cupin domain-containing protein [Roseovarius sp.]